MPNGQYEQCLCGDLYCPSCGPAQGNEKCPYCGAWEYDRGCKDRLGCDGLEAGIAETEDTMGGRGENG